MKEIPRMDEAQIKEAVMGLLHGHIYTADMCPPDMIGMVFFPVLMGGLDDFDLDQIGNVYEYMDKAGERSINGCPIFLSCRVVHKDDWDVIVKRAMRVHAIMEKALSE